MQWFRLKRTTEPNRTITKQASKQRASSERFIKYDGLEDAPLTMCSKPRRLTRLILSYVARFIEKKKRTNKHVHMSRFATPRSLNPSKAHSIPDSPFHFPTSYHFNDPTTHTRSYQTPHTHIPPPLPPFLLKNNPSTSSSTALLRFLAPQPQRSNPTARLSSGPLSHYILLPIESPKTQHPPPSPQARGTSR